MGAFVRKSLTSTEGARLAEEKDYKDYLNSRNRGLLLDGKNLALSPQDSFRHLAVMSNSGAGKTSRYIVNNVFHLAAGNNSIVVNDPKAEIYKYTSGYLKKQGYRIVYINPSEPEFSEGFNPFEEAMNDIERSQLADIIMRAAMPKQDFWSEGATRFIRLFLRCLAINGQRQDGVNNLHNLYRLFLNFGQDGEALNTWVARNSVLPNDLDDESIVEEWVGLLTGHREGILSFIVNALTALKAMADTDMAKVTARSTFSLADIRKEKTAIFFCVPARYATHYSFLSSMFFRSVFNACMREEAGRSTIPAYILFDEAGHTPIPDFATTITTIRSYRVSISIILQSISQLSALYSKHEAASIQGGISSYMTYGGSDEETTQFFQNKAGMFRTTVEPHEFNRFEQRINDHHLLQASDIRTMNDDTALFVSANRYPVMLRTYPYYKLLRYLWWYRKEPVALPGQEPETLRRIEL